MKPILFLDVDGVLVGLQALNTLRGRELRLPYLQLKPLMGSFFQEARAHFDIVWATAWGEEANGLLPALWGFPVPLPQFSLPAIPVGGDKLDEILAYTKGRKDWLWIDDSVWPDQVRRLQEAGCTGNFIHVSSAVEAEILLDMTLQWLDERRPT